MAIDLADNDCGLAMFNSVTELIPGCPLERCIPMAGAEDGTDWWRGPATPTTWWPVPFRGRGAWARAVPPAINGWRSPRGACGDGRTGGVLAVACALEVERVRTATSEELADPRPHRQLVVAVGDGLGAR